MQAVRKLIEDNIDRYEHHDYYLIPLEKAEKNLKTHPDICIESCKTLIEGVCKAILKHMDNAFDEKAVEGMKPRKLAERALGDLAKYDENIEADFIADFADLMQRLTTIRNKRGDISHGHVAPKPQQSTEAFAAYIYNLTEVTVSYMLEVFYAVDLSYMDKIEYEANPDFNDYLDEQYPLEGKVRYSAALYEQDFIEYETLLEDYRSYEEEIY